MDTEEGFQDLTSFIHYLFKVTMGINDCCRSKKIDSKMQHLYSMKVK